jgi:hypothetical protein
VLYYTIEQYSAVAVVVAYEFAVVELETDLIVVVLMKVKQSK